MPKKVPKNKAWIVDVSMGYGHQRTAYPLRDIAFGGIIKADDYKGMPWRDRSIWKNSREFYEGVSKFKNFPILGELIFGVFDEAQKIYPFYPRQDRSKLKTISKISYQAIDLGWGKDLIKKLSRYKIPFVSSFFTPAFMAEKFNYPGDIYIIVCDTDISRSWVPKNPKISRIKYFASTQRSAWRLESYGVKKENIFYTGYPLPSENLKDSTLSLLRDDMKKRIVNLDPKGVYFQKYRSHISFHLGSLPNKSGRPFTMTFAIGGAGAQKELVMQAVESLSDKIKNKSLEIILVAGIKKEIKDCFAQNLKKIGLGKFLGSRIKILYEAKIDDYFKSFNRELRNTDVLWTKPSELSFYSGLGIPIMIMPEIGYQEKFNKAWLLQNGFGILPDRINCVGDWIDDYLDQGYLADIAMQAFVENKQDATFKIKKIIFNKKI